MFKNLADKEVTKTMAFQAMKEYLQKEIDLSVRKCMDEAHFEKASWSEYLAYQLGLQKSYTKLLSFLPDRVIE